MTLRELLDTRFGGVIRSGKHDENGQCCALELVSAYRQIPWTDSPEYTGMPDLRGLNDAFVRDASRTAAMVPLIEALLGWREWKVEQRAEWARRVSKRMIREIVPIVLESAASIHPAPKHAKAMRSAAERCRNDGSARRAAEGAASARSAANAAWSAESAASAASRAAWNAASSAASAASAASAESAESAARSAAASAASARSAANAAERAERDRVLTLAAAIMTEEAINSGAGNGNDS